ncbi:MAG: type III-B CRISPR-associated protein Cas10/Cmr2 [Cyanobacteriota bacterium]|nr:type III-B CRISPR-associated protein Cas10/Cmr2 [Cyanobacteriota bacterium]
MMTETTVYTAITFSPVQGFIEKSRKLRDLYGSSFILSYLASTVCWEAQRQGGEVISPALINVIQGTPNQIVIRKNFSEEEIEKALEVFEVTSEENAVDNLLEAFQKAIENTFNYRWRQIVDRCRTWAEEQCQAWIQPQRREWVKRKEWREDTSVLPWERDWQLWANHAWEFFGAHGDSISAAREALNEKKRQRNWIAPNWTGESSTLSGADAVAYPGMSRISPKQWDYHQEKTAIESFYKLLSEKVGEAFLQHIAQQLCQSPDFTSQQLVDKYGKGFLKFVRRILPHKTSSVPQDLAREYGEAIIDPDEELSIPELVKRLVTLEAIAQPIGIPLKEIPETFRDLSRLNPKKKKDPQEQSESEPDNRKTGWFRGDGDSVGKHLQKLKKQGGDEARNLHEFSSKMMKWGEESLKPSLPSGKGRIIYAGGDDFLGVFFRTPPDLRYLQRLIRYLKEQLRGQLSPEEKTVLDTVAVKGLHKAVKLPEELRKTLAIYLERHQNDSTLKENLAHAGLQPEEAIALFRQPVLTADECLEWFYRFRSTAEKPKERSDNAPEPADLWSCHDQPITASIGFVWAAPNVPQRDVLQHCQDAEQTAKRKGRDRLCIRILFNSGNFLQWTCPWWFLKVLQEYRDRDRGNNWTHIYNDVAILESRRAFEGQRKVALELFELYFGKDNRNKLNPQYWWNDEDTKQTGILGESENYIKNNLCDREAVDRDITNWIINLAKVGFHLCKA